MTYIREWDDLPWEAAEDEGRTFAFWPRVDGRLVLASAVSGEVTWTAHKPDGTSVGSGTITPATVSMTGRNVSRFDIPFPAVSERGEGYQVRVTWRADGETEDRYDRRLVDVVRYPFDQPQMTFNDFVEERSDAGPLLDRIGQRLGYTAGDDAREYAASVMAGRARGELYSLVRDSIRKDSNTAAETSAGGATNPKRARPNLIVRTEPLGRVERFLAMKALYHSVSKRPEDGDGEADEMYRDYRKLAAEAWSRVGGLEYDGDEDGVADAVLEDSPRITYHRRVQA